MTTPRDDIAGLSERLREQTRHWTGIMSRHPAFLDPELSITMMEAAAQLDALSADRDMIRIRMEELEHERDALSARVKELDQQTSDLETLKNLYRKDCKEAEARATRLQQERDEAVGLLRPLVILAEDSASLLSKHNSKFAPEMSSLAASARSFVRRLASGPEKEKKE